MCVLNEDRKSISCHVTSVIIGSSGLSAAAAADDEDDDDDDDDDDAIVMMMYEIQRGVTAAADDAECSYGDGIHGDVLAGKT